MNNDLPDRIISRDEEMNDDESDLEADEYAFQELINPRFEPEITSSCSLAIEVPGKLTYLDREDVYLSLSRTHALPEKSGEGNNPGGRRVSSSHIQYPS